MKTYWFICSYSRRLETRNAKLSKLVWRIFQVNLNEQVQPCSKDILESFLYFCQKFFAHWQPSLHPWPKHIVWFIYFLKQSIQWSAPHHFLRMLINSCCKSSNWNHCSTCNISNVPLTSQDSQNAEVEKIVQAWAVVTHYIKFHCRLKDVRNIQALVSRHLPKRNAMVFRTSPFLCGKAD